MSEIFEPALAALVALLVATVVLSPVACTMRRDALVAQAIRSGADPILTRCAMDGDFRSSVCVMRAQAAPAKRALGE